MINFNNDENLSRIQLTGLKKMAIINGRLLNYTANASILFSKARYI